ncbi:histidine phosphatase family protein [Metabacillus mangrovi]|nr:histidine phosphatase family protein [Metabacillus mangrovi]
MKISLMRHYEVECPYPNRMYSAEFTSWCSDYDSAPLIPVHFEAQEGSWDACFSSDLPRAVRTAESVYGVPVQTPLLREVPLSPFLAGGPRLPYHIWTVMGRLCWLMSHPSQMESKHQTALRAGRWIEEAEGSGHEHILAVSHGFFIPVLAGELRKKGYSGRKPGKLKNGEIILMEK